MAEILPINFPLPPEPAIISYSWTDLDSGTGYVDYFLLGTKNTSGETVLLTPSSSVVGFWDSQGNGFNETTYHNFDVTFNHPRTIKGRAYFSGQMFDLDNNSKVTAKLIHYDGSTETVIGAETVTFEIANGTYNFCLCWDVSQTLFKKGETLRLAVKVGQDGCEICIDPTGTTPAIKPARLSVPFKIDT